MYMIVDVEMKYTCTVFVQVCFLDKEAPAVM